LLRKKHFPVPGQIKSGTVLARTSASPDRRALARLYAYVYGFGQSFALTGLFSIYRAAHKQ
jgi:hypothetical protein